MKRGRADLANKYIAKHSGPAKTIRVRLSKNKNFFSTIPRECASNNR
jgi:hypothetical protein